MKILVINGHPDKESYCQAIFQTIVENIDSGRHELEVINLNEEDFDPVLRYGYRKRMEILPYSVSEKERLDLATHVIFNTFLILLYILAWKLVDATTFGNNWMGLLLFALFYSLFTGVVATIVGTLITEKNHQTISTLVNMLLIFSSGILPLDKISPVFGFLSGNLVQRFIYTPFVDLMNGASVGDMIPSATLILCILSFVFVLRIKRKEAQQ